jgi:hypothetical protein
LALWFSSCACCSSAVPEPDNAVHDPAVLMAHLQSRLEGLSSARIQAVGEYYGGDVRGANVRTIVLVRRPADLHVQVLDPMGNPLESLFCNGQQLSLYDLAEQRYYYGAPTPENLARLMPFYMGAEDIVRVFLGGAPLDMIDGDATHHQLSWDGERGAYLWTVPLASQPG